MGVEIEARRFGLGRRRVQRAQADAGFVFYRPVELAGPNRSDPGINHGVRRRLGLDDLPAVDIVVGLHARTVERRRRPVRDPARHPHLAVLALGLDRKIDDRAIADGFGVHIAEMRQIEQIVVDQLVVALDAEKRARIMRPGRIVDPPPVGNQRLVRRRVAHPDPQEAVFLDQRKRSDRGAGRHLRLAGHGDADAGRVEFKPVITALHPVARDFAERQWQMPVTAPVLQRHGRAAGGAEHHDRFAQKRAPQRPAVFELAYIGGHVPAIFHKHGESVAALASASIRSLFRDSIETIMDPSNSDLNDVIGDCQK